MVIDDGLLTYLDRQLKRYRADVVALRDERDELRARLEDAERERDEAKHNYGLLIAAIRREFDDVVALAHECDFPDDGLMVIPCGALRRIYAIDEAFDNTTVQDAIAWAEAFNQRAASEG